MAGIPQRRLRADQLAGIARGQIVLAYVQAGLEQQGEVGAIVHDERRAALAAEAGDQSRAREEIAAPVAFLADLQDARSTLQKGRGCGFQGDFAALERFRVENRINARQFHRWGTPALALARSQPKTRSS